MKSIKVHINKLGLIRNADIEIKPLMLFSGYSGLGKSYVAILCHYFFAVCVSDRRLNTYFKQVQESKGISFFDSEKRGKSMASFTISKDEIEDWLAKDAVDYLRYMLGYPVFEADIKVEIPVSTDFSFQYEEEVIGLENNVEMYNKVSIWGGLSYRFKELGITDESPYAIVFRFALIKILFGDWRSLNYCYVLPPARGMYMSEDSDMPMFSKAKTGLYQSFFSDMQELKAAIELPEKVSPDLIKTFKDVLSGEVKRDGGEYVYVTHGKTLPISAAAASVREIGPLQQLILKRDISKTSILIEEPESHLHPLKQIQMADIIALMSKGGANMQITTHSDYFLRRLNDLIRLHILKGKDERKYKELCEEYGIPDLTLDSSILSAYYLEQAEEGGDVQIKRQDITTGIPFDTFDSANDKPLDLSVILYELTNDSRDGESNC